MRGGLEGEGEGSVSTGRKGRGFAELCRTYHYKYLCPNLSGYRRRKVVGNIGEGWGKNSSLNFQLSILVLADFLSPAYLFIFIYNLYSPKRGWGGSI